MILIYNSQIPLVNINENKQDTNLSYLDLATIAEDRALIHSIEDHYKDDLEEKTFLKELPETVPVPEQRDLKDEQVDEKESQSKFYLDFKDKIVTISGHLNYGETLYKYLINHDISPNEILRLQEKVQPIVDISRLNVGTEFKELNKEK